MADVLGMIVPQNEQEEIKEFVSTLLLLPKEDRAILLSNANAFKVRRDIERARKWGDDMNRKEIERIAVIKNGTKEIGYMDENKNFVTCDDMLNHLAIDVFQSICEIRSGEKKAEETNIEVEISALNSLANAVNALSNYSKTFR